MRFLLQVLKAFKSPIIAFEETGRVDYGALGVGGLKMKIHKAAIRELFASNQNFIDAEKMLEIGRGIMAT